jgi:hypothetical protein
MNTIHTPNATNKTQELVTKFLDHGRYLRGWNLTTLRTYRQVLSRFTVEHVSKHTLHEYILGLQTRGLSAAGWAGCHYLQLIVVRRAEAATVRTTTRHVDILCRQGDNYANAHARHVSE